MPRKPVKVRAWSFPSTRSSEIVYQVDAWSDGSVTCNCPGWRFVKPGKPRGCAHTRHVETVQPFIPHASPIVTPVSITPASVIGAIKNAGSPRPRKAPVRPDPGPPVRPGGGGRRVVLRDE